MHRVGGWELVEGWLEVEEGAMWRGIEIVLLVGRGLCLRTRVGARGRCGLEVNGSGEGSGGREEGEEDHYTIFIVS